ncbi:MAG: transferrin-binding protein-like solute binding protein [Geminicoccaceae bacterium]|nr:transferrin-binding protein-like solute binding protein [Geminicoccaceae bacterium]
MSTRYKSGILALGLAAALAGCSGSGGDVKAVLGGVSGATDRTSKGEPRVTDLQGRTTRVSNAGNDTWRVDTGDYDKDWDNGDVSSTPGNVTVYTKGAGRDVLRVDEDSLDHARFGSWLRTSGPEGTGTAEEAGGFVVSTSGLRGDDIPGQGTATYAGTVEGNYLNATGAERLTGTMRASADFSDKTVSTTLDVRSDSVSDTIASGLARIDTDTALGTRVGKFETNAATSANGFAGRLGGSFFGSNAKEIGGTFDLRQNDERYIGAFGGD